MRIVFLGTPDFAVPTLERLARHAPAAGWALSAAVCQPDRPAGRGGALHAPAVKLAALRLGLPVYQPERIRRPEALEWLRAQRPDVLVVVAFGQLLPAPVFELPSLGAINAHASLLPAYRGAAPIQWAIANGEMQTGVTTMRIDAGLDTGDMLLQQSIPIAPEVTAPELSAALAGMAAELIVATLAGLESGAITPRPQPRQGTMAPLLSRADGAVDWQRPAREIYNRWRGFQPWPGIFGQFRGQTLAILRCRPVADGAALGGGDIAVGANAPGLLLAAGGGLAVQCGEGALLLEEVRLPGRRAVSGAEFARGAHLEWGSDRLG